MGTKEKVLLEFITAIINFIAALITMASLLN